MTEAMQSMRAIKVLTLEGHVVQKVEAARAAEFGALCRYQDRRSVV